MTTALDPQIGAQLLAQLGFLLVPGPPSEHGPAYLLVALRRQPTLRHFDPQRVDYWVSDDGRGTRASLDCATHMPLQADFSWAKSAQAYADLYATALVRRRGAVVPV